MNEPINNESNLTNNENNSTNEENNSKNNENNSKNEENNSKNNENNSENDENNLINNEINSTNEVNNDSINNESENNMFSVNDNGFSETLGFFISFLISAFVFYGTMIKIMLKRWKLALIITIVVIIIIILSIILQIIFIIQNKIHKLTKFHQKLGSFVSNFLPLLIIPSTETFFINIEGKNFKEYYFIYLTWAYNSILIPLSMIIIMIIYCHPDIEGKYRKTSCKYNYLYWFELVDILCQFGYAISASKDCLEACIAIETFWIVVVVIFRPFEGKSEYPLTIGNSIILILSNGFLLFNSKNETVNVKFGIVVVCFVIACIPAIVSIYVFFICDFEIKFDDENENNNDDDDLAIKLSLKVCQKIVYFIPIAWFLFGLNISYISTGTVHNEKAIK